MKLLSLNVESKNHFTRTLPFIEQLDADVVCLQESTLEYEEFLKNKGYNTHFVPRCIKEHDGQDFVDGLLIGTKYPATFEAHFYHKPTDAIPREVFDPKEERYDNHQVCVLAHLSTQDGIYTIVNNHFTWTPEGHKPGIAQRKDITAFMDIARALPPHVMCGDFNIPRGHNALYEHLKEVYTDNVPDHYTSSLDKKHHRIGHLPEKQNLFTDYMVDYVFTQAPYTARDVELVFDLSDHAAVVATISK